MTHVRSNGTSSWQVFFLGLCVGFVPLMGIGGGLTNQFGISYILYGLGMLAIGYAVARAMGQVPYPLGITLPRWQLTALDLVYGAYLVVGFVIAIRAALLGDPSESVDLLIGIALVIISCAYLIHRDVVRHERNSHDTA